jgi:PIN domain nuclease of toxin-antitoxin system
LSVVADTHAMIWYVDAPQELSPAATAAMDVAANTGGEYIFISAITLVEMRYLVEKNRIKAAVLTRIEQELDEPDPMIVATSVDRTIYDALALIPRSVVPDMPDRIIAATALALGLPLVTRDTEIRQLTNVTTVW